jgi:hypothetical protein
MGRGGGHGSGGAFTFVEVDSSGGLRSTNRTGTMSSDGTQLSWDDAFRPWIRCSTSPNECTGNVRYDSDPSCVNTRIPDCEMPSTPVEYGMMRRTHRFGYTALLPVNRLYEFEWDLRERDRVDIERVRAGCGHAPTRCLHDA